MHGGCIASQYTPGSFTATAWKPRLNHLQALEAESLYILREAVAECARPVMLYSIGKDSSVMLRLAQKAFHPGKLPFPLLHVDTGYKFPEMLAFRDAHVREIGAELIVHRNEEAVAAGMSPGGMGTQNCCDALKTRSLLQALRAGGFDAAFGGARRDEEASRAKERVYSFRDAAGRWDPGRQRPELWSLYNPRLRHGESMRVFPLSNWTELDIWLYILTEQIPVVPLYFAQDRSVVVRSGTITLLSGSTRLLPHEKAEIMRVRMRSLGCVPCTGAIRSEADTLPKILAELVTFRRSERENRTIDHDEEGSMERKKRKGYF